MTVDADFTTQDPAATIVAHVSEIVRSLGWSSSPDATTPGLYTWHRALAGGVVADARLFDPTYGAWSIDASTPPVTHPATGC